MQLEIIRQFIPNDKLKHYIEQKDLDAVREHIGTMIYTDRAFLHGEFESAVNYVIEECYMTELFESFNPLPPLKSKSGTTDFKEADFTEAVFELKSNFCRERIEDVKTIGRYLYKQMQSETENTMKKNNKKNLFQRIFKK